MRLRLKHSLTKIQLGQCAVKGNDKGNHKGNYKGWSIGNCAAAWILAARLIAEWRLWPLATIFLLLVGLSGRLVQAQQYTLSAPGVEFTSKAYLTDAKLDVIDSQGNVNTYVRDIQFDTTDGNWRGYRSRESGRVLRWPRSNSGNLQIGNVQGGSVSFTVSRMQIQLARSDQLGGVANPSRVPGVLESGLSRQRVGGMPGNLPEYHGQSWKSFAASDILLRIISNPINRLPSPQPIHLVSYDAGGMPWAMLQRGTGLGVTSQSDARAMWWIAPVSPGMVRLQMMTDGQVWCVTADDRGLRLSLVSQDPRQLWRVSNCYWQPDHYMFENAFFVGNYLTQLGAGNLGMQPMLGLPTQGWMPLLPPQSYLSLMEPFWRSVHREIQPNPPLPPAEVELNNSHKYALIVLVGDLRNGQLIQEVRVEPNSTTKITVERDAGATLIEDVQVMTPVGSWNQQRFTSQIPPVSLYDLSVYEEFLQSIAIDRTGKSPNPIEDINYVPKSVGLLVLPAGQALPEQGELDLYSQSKAANNAGAVRRMDLKRLEKPKSDPLESILEGIQKQRSPNTGRSF